MAYPPTTRVDSMTTDNRPPPYSIRLAPELRAKLEEAAKITGRTLPAEISARLESTFHDEPLSLAAQLAPIMQAKHTTASTPTPSSKELFMMLEELRGRVEELERRTSDTL